MDNRRIEIAFFFILFAGISFLMFRVLRPFLEVLVLAAVAAVLFQGFYKRVLHIFRYRQNVAATFVVITLIFFVVTPLFYVGIQVLAQTQHLYAIVEGDTARFSNIVERTIESPIRQIFPEFRIDVKDLSVKALRSISNNLGTLVSQTLGVFFQTFLFLMAFFFFLRDGGRMLGAFWSLSPFEDRYTGEIVYTTRRTVLSVIRETVVIIAIRWLLVGFGFYFCGIPNAVFWGSLAGIVGAIPSFGTPVVIIPAAFYLYSQGAIVPMIGIIAVGLFIMLVIENILAPYMLGKGFDVSPIFALLSVFGGLVMFGPFGLIFGPIILSLFLSAINIYRILCLEKTIK